LLSDDEKKQLLEMASKDFEEELTEEIEKLDNEEKELQEKISNVKESLEKNNDNWEFSRIWVSWSIRNV